MDELELLKKDWNKGEKQFKSYSDSDIKPMLNNKSSSIVKTLFYISIGELVFWLFVGILPYFLSTSFKNSNESSSEHLLTFGFNIFSYSVIILFIYLLFKSYKSITSTDNTKKLMESILKTRKIIKYYVIFNLSLIFLSVLLAFYFEYTNNLEFHQMIVDATLTQMIVIFAGIALVAGIFLIILWLIYKLTYGLLLRKLNKNYEELKKLEV